jgi:tRNA(Ile)-lysidine synthase
VGPHPAVAQTRLAVRRCLAAALAADLAPGDLVLAACSGGADSLALAAALAFEGPRLGLRSGGVTVDHGLQPGSAAQASRVTVQLTGLGLDPVHAVTAAIAGRDSRTGHDGPQARDGQDGRDARRAYPGPEAAARAGRYAALDQVASATGAVAILLGHTLDDQAETVLLGLARGSGARSLAGMAPRSGRYLRPLLDVPRAQTEAACAALGLPAWADPQNSDPAYARVRVRASLLPALEAELGPGVSSALARTARRLRADADALDELAARQAEQLADGQPGWSAAALAALPEAIRGRVLRRAALAAGARAGALSEFHVVQLGALVTDWRGQQGVDLPGGVRCRRRCGRLHFAPVPHPADPADQADPAHPAYEEGQLAGLPWEGCSGRE